MVKCYKFANASKSVKLSLFASSIDDAIKALNETIITPQDFKEYGMLITIPCPTYHHKDIIDEQSIIDRQDGSNSKLD